MLMTHEYEVLINLVARALLWPLIATTIIHSVFITHQCSSNSMVTFYKRSKLLVYMYYIQLRYFLTSLLTALLPT